MRIRSGLFCGSIYWVLLVSGRVSVPKPLSQIQRGTRRLLQGLSPRTSFGGFGVSLPALAQLHETGPKLARRRKVEVVKELGERKLLSDRVLDDLAAFLEEAARKAVDDHAVLVHGDLTEDHVLLSKRDGGWEITGLLDLGDAHACPKEYEWPALWLGALGRDAAALRAFFESYDPTALEREDFLQRAFAWTLLHDFGAGMVEDVLKGYVGPPIDSVDRLREVMWPDSILTRHAS